MRVPITELKSLIQQTKQVMTHIETHRRSLQCEHIVNIVNVSVLPTEMLPGRPNLPGNSSVSEI